MLFLRQNSKLDQDSGRELSPADGCLDTTVPPSGYRLIGWIPIRRCEALWCRPCLSAILSGPSRAWTIPSRRFDVRPSTFCSLTRGLSGRSGSLLAVGGTFTEFPKQEPQRS